MTTEEKPRLDASATEAPDPAKVEGVQGPPSAPYGPARRTQEAARPERTPQAPAQQHIGAKTHGPVDRRAPVERIQLDGTSWIDVVRGFAHDTPAAFERLLRDVAWRDHFQIREGRRVRDPRLYGVISRVQAEADPLFRFTRLVLDARYQVRLSGPQLVYYRDGRDGMGFHRDDEMRWLDRTVIAGLALGGSRPFQLVHRAGGPVTEIELASGDLYVMGGRCQADWFHGVPKRSQADPKISAVWRWTAREGRPVKPYRA